MIYFKFGKDNNKVLFCFDENSGITYKFDEGQWSISKYVYSVLIHDEDVIYITETEADKLTNGKSVHKILDFVDNLLNGQI
ncbi:MAG: hypothetical protein IKM43_04050 [Clostridia bacterium]|nr:hypothetical protein [Clostridia bacterium]